MLLWAGLVILRLGWAVLPQTGYIHPDEFFQIVEVTAGDVFNVSVEHTWEFEPSFPLRSMVLPNILFYPVFKSLKAANESWPNYHISGSDVLSGARLAMAILSLWMDFCIYMICSEMKIRGYTATLLLASSYVMLTYQTHSFTNSLESLLLITVIFLLIKFVYTQCNTNEKSRHSEINSTDRSSVTSKMVADVGSSSKHSIHSSSVFETTRRRKKGNNSDLRKEFEQLKQSRSKNSTTNNQKESGCYFTVILLAVLNTAGIFNRPTFVGFSIVPFLWWLYRISSNTKYLVRRVVAFVSVSLITTMLFCVLDTWYHRGYDTMTLIFTKLDMTQIVFTPFNFIEFNTAFDNIKSHGNHPLYLHILVNMPLLYGPLIVYIVIAIARHIHSLLSRSRSKIHVTSQLEMVGLDKENLKDVDHRTNNLNVPMLAFIVTPVLLLSLFPHQEPRFLIPLLPLVIICAVETAKQFGKLFLSFFISFNIILSIFYGVLHQGGVTPCLNHLQQLSSSQFSNNSNISVSIIFSKTYMPPKHLLLLNEHSHVNLIDLKGCTFDTVHDLIAEIENRNEHNISEINTSDSFVYLALPGTLVEEFVNIYWGSLSFKVTEKFFPHLSLENPPQLSSILNFKHLTDKLSLYLIEVSKI